ncbi:FAD-binding protein [Micromonospora sp. NBC_01739]|uniref:FAD-binding oxidoreductase n=1 Tax=unclassified Micromonospora TaxID=2617518 RepID=UPI002E0E71F2|nr:FAD-binding protein [Micromonospora sp. NBC_01739]
MTRRGFLSASAAAGGMAVGGLWQPGSAAAGGCAPSFGPVTVRTRDPRYQELTTRAYNGRFVGRPDEVRLVGSADQIVRAVTDAVRTGKRLAVRSGGHCFENIPDAPDVRMVIDLSEMNEVSFDPVRRAFVVEAGATLGQIYRKLFLGWGVTLPGGTCPTVGAGGHVVGGGYGALSHRYGSVVDHLYAVEVVVVDRSGQARKVVATREPDDPHRDLWWAHTGGGGGNFGIVSRYWFRSPQARGSDPARLLPKPPVTLRQASVSWQWADIDEAAFARLIHNYTTWHREHPGADLHAGLSLLHRAAGEIRLDVQLDEEQPGAEQLMAGYIAAIGAGVPATPATQVFTWPWLRATTSLYPGLSGYRIKSKSALLRRPWTDQQIAVVHRYLQQGGAEHYPSGAYLSTFGGQINAVPANATAMVHRDAAFSSFFETAWSLPEEDEHHLSWIRGLYRDVHADTGGVPVPGPAYSGTFVNYLDADLADPVWNTSGTPWHALYYRENYPRLQQVKARWDPRGVFRHLLSVRPA